MIRIDSERSTIKVLVKFFTANMMANPSFSIFECFFSAEANVRDVKAISHSDPSSTLWARTAPPTHLMMHHMIVSIPFQDHSVQERMTIEVLVLLSQMLRHVLMSTPI